MKNKFLLLIGALALLATTKSFADTFYTIDGDGNGSELFTLSGSSSNDPDGALVDYQWKVNGTLVSSGTAPQVPDMSYTYSVGLSTVTLIVRDDALASNTTSSFVIVLNQSSNRPPVADASIPSLVMASSSNVAAIFADASASSDPDGDPIVHYRWTEGTTTYYDGTAATATLTLNGLGNHTLQLKVYSQDNTYHITQSGTKNFDVAVDPLSEKLAGRSFTLVTAKDFSFDPPYDSFAGVARNPLSDTLFVTDNAQDKIFEIQLDGTLVRTIDIAALKRSGIATTDAEAIAWMHGNVFALALHDGKEIAVVTILSTTSAIARSEATIYDVSSGPGKPKGLTYAGWEDAFYWVSKDAPKSIVKSRINTSTGKMDTIWSKNVDNLPPSDLSDIEIFPRLTTNLLLISESSKTITEVDVSGSQAVMVSSFSLAGWNIPQASDFTFGADAKMYVVGKHVSGVPEDDFNVFAPTATIPNLSPKAKINGVFGAVDSDGDGFANVLVDGLGSSDTDGAIIRFEWYVNGVKINEGFGPKVTQFDHAYAVGTSTLTLIVYDDAQAVGQDSAQVIIKPKGSNLPPVADANVPGTVLADNAGAAAVVVDASLSSDPENDSITRYTWTEGASTYYDGPAAGVTLTAQGLGDHNLKLAVYSTDSNGITQTGSKDFFLPFSQRPPKNLRGGISLT